MDVPFCSLPENRGIAFAGDPTVGRADCPAKRARLLLAAPNPHGKPNSDVVRPWAGAEDLLRMPRNRWTVDFPPGMDAREAALYELPHALARRRSVPTSHGAKAAGLRIALAKRDRFLATPASGPHRLFAWLPTETLPDRSLVVFARDDDWFLGMLHSHCHELWRQLVARAPRAGRARYTPLTLETFPFPWPPAQPLGKLTRRQDELRSAIALAAGSLVAARNAWLGERTDRRRTLAKLYEAQPAWLQVAHAALDEAVTAAYGWPADLTDDALAAHLLDLNRQRGLVL